MGETLPTQGSLGVAASVNVGFKALRCMKPVTACGSVGQ